MMMKKAKTTIRERKPTVVYDDLLGNTDNIIFGSVPGDANKLVMDKSKSGIKGKNRRWHHQPLML